MGAAPAVWSALNRAERFCHHSQSYQVVDRLRPLDAAGGVGTSPWCCMTTSVPWTTPFGGYGLGWCTRCGTLADASQDVGMWFIEVFPVFWTPI